MQSKHNKSDMVCDDCFIGEHVVRPNRIEQIPLIGLWSLETGELKAVCYRCYENYEKSAEWHRFPLTWSRPSGIL